ncbi:MAG: hypothetical protein KC731_05985, partial [Myxococcales bacterium]|nr:hypothetical protein [Myxococcales bacterium]
SPSRARATTSPLAPARASVAPETPSVIPFTPATPPALPPATSSADPRAPVVAEAYVPTFAPAVTPPLAIAPPPIVAPSPAVQPPAPRPTNPSAPANLDMPGLDTATLDRFERAKRRRRISSLLRGRAETERPPAPIAGGRRSAWMVALAVGGLVAMTATAIAMSPDAASHLTTHFPPAPQLPEPDEAEIGERRAGADAAPAGAEVETKAEVETEAEAVAPEPKAPPRIDRTVLASHRASHAPRRSSQFLDVLRQQAASDEPGTLVARARGGSCQFWVDGVQAGAGKVVRIPARPGPHKVACRPDHGKPQSQVVRVAPGGIGVAGFYLR